jgi:hypothetical protein
MRIAMLILILSLMVLPLSAQLLTPQEIESALGSKTSYTKAEVVTIIQGLLQIVEDEVGIAQAEVEKIHQDKFKELKDTFQTQINDISFSKNLWEAIGIGEAVVIVLYSGLRLFNVVK